jgi:type I restriction enzyme S subunit
MKKVKFGDLFTFISKTTNKAGIGKDRGKYEYYTSSSVIQFLDTYDFKGPAIIFSTGGKAIVHYSENFFSVSADCLVAHNKNSLSIQAENYVITKYVYYYLFYKIHLLEQGFQGAGLKHISKNFIKNLLIEFPSIEEQIKLVEILDNLISLLNSRDNTLELLKGYIYSTYHFLFYKNYNRNLPKIKISSISKTSDGIRTGPFGSDLLHSEFSNSGYAYVVGIDNIVKNRFIFTEDRYITLDKFKQLAKFSLKPRDVLISIMGTIGRSAVTPSGLPRSINTKHNVAITVNEKIIDPYYLSYSIHADPFVVSQLNSFARGAIMGGLNLAIIKNISLNLPNLNLQKRFSRIAQKYENLISILERNKINILNFINSFARDAFNAKMRLISSNASRDIKFYTNLENSFIDYRNEKTVLIVNLNEINAAKNKLMEIINSHFKHIIFGYRDLFNIVREKKLDINYEFIKEALFSFLIRDSNNSSLLTQKFDNTKGVVFQVHKRNQKLNEIIKA